MADHVTERGDSLVIRADDGSRIVLKDVALEDLTAENVLF